jgi:hypothetical protein
MSFVFQSRPFHFLWPNIMRHLGQHIGLRMLNSVDFGIFCRPRSQSLSFSPSADEKEDGRGDRGQTNPASNSRSHNGAN